MKYIFLILTLSICVNSFGQVKVLQGNNSSEFKLSKQPVFTSYSTDNADYFVIRITSETFERINTLIVADKSGNIITDKEITVNRGMMNNINNIKELLVVGNTPVVFVENHNRDGGKNTFTARTIDKNGNVNATGIDIGSIDMGKMSAPGDWYVCLTPDKKHVAVIGKMAHVKDAPDQFKYFILDDNLKEVSKGQFSFAGNTKEIEVYNFSASDKGDFYIVADEFDKSYKYPVLYKYTAGGQATIIPVMISDPGLKNLSYTMKVNQAGELVIAGYMQKKKTFSAGDPEATGSWLFNSSKINEVKTFNFDKPIINMTARNIVYNGDTFYLVGEQYKADKQSTGMQQGMGLSRMSMAGVFDYTHNDILATGFTVDGNKKFEIPISRKWMARDFDQEFMVSSGIINGKLALIYNDQYGKYIDDRVYKNHKLPVSVLITNDGLMEAPVQFAKELDVKISTYVLYPQFFSANNGQIMVLSANANSVKTITFK